MTDEPELVPASRRRRFIAAALVPTAILVGGSVGVGALGYAVATRGSEDALLASQERWLANLTRFQESALGQVIFARQPIYAYAAAVRRRNRPRPGQGLLGLRTVDARTGGPVTVRSAVIGYASAEGLTIVSQWLFPAPVPDESREGEEQGKAILGSCLGRMVVPLIPRLLARRNVLDRLSGTVVVRV